MEEVENYEECSKKSFIVIANFYSYMLISLRRHETCEKQTSWLVGSRGLMPVAQGHHGIKAILLHRATVSKNLMGRIQLFGFHNHV